MDSKIQLSKPECGFIARICVTADVLDSAGIMRKAESVTGSNTVTDLRLPSPREARLHRLAVLLVAERLFP
jgi:hypothetical protein